MLDAGDFSQKGMQSLLEERSKRVLRRFRQEAIAGVSDPKLLEILRFVCDYWKDKFRPTFASLCCEAAGGQAEAADDVSLMITLTSAGGGIHDDILDKSSNKHFRMTVLGKYGADYALLVGDHLILKGWIMARNIAQRRSQYERFAEIIQVFGQWTLDVCEAEFMEIQCRQNLETELEQYQKILSKSMADTQACAKLGAIMGGGLESETQAMSLFGSRLGFMYRLIDDLKDTLNVEHNLSYRLKYESVPLPILYAAKNSEKRKSTLKEVFAKSYEDGINSDEIVRACLEAESFQYVLELGEQTTKEALSDLDKLKPSSAKNLLGFMIKSSLAEIAPLVSLAN